MYHYRDIKNVLLFLLIPVLILVFIFLFFFFISDLNRILETIIKNVSFIFYTFMFLSSGFNIFEMIKTGNPKYIMIPNSIIGIVSNIAMILFIISLNRFNSISIYFIIYPLIAIIFCIFEVIFYFCKSNKKNQNLLIEDDSNAINNDDNDNDDENTEKGKNISLVKRRSTEED